MQSEYPMQSLGDLVKLRSGYSFKSADWVDSGCPVIKITNIKSGRISRDGCAYVTKQVAEKAAEWWTRDGDVLIAMTGYVGEVARVKEGEKFLINQRVGRFDFKNQNILDPEYFFYVAQHPEFRAEIEGLARGSAQPNLSAKDIEGVQVPLPMLAVQKSIASALSSLDGRIDLARGSNKTLESISKALFKIWLIDFDPVRAKAEGREPEGMSADIAALFPSEFVDSELGPIPKGWVIRSLDEIASFLNGLAMQKFPPDGDDSLPVIKIAQLRKGDTVGADRASSRIDPAYVVNDGDVLFSWSGTLEVDVWAGGRGGLNQHLFKVTSSTFPKWFYYLAVKHHLAGFREIAANKATTMGHIQRRHLSDARLAVPDESLMVHLGGVFAPLFERALLARIQERSLTAIRDLLLPSLLSGRITPGLI